MKNLIPKITLFALLGVAGSSFAHHSSAPHFDESVEIRVEGTVTSWSFVNPHSYIYFDAVGANGEIENWRCEMHAKTPMQRNGFTDKTFVPGQKITFIGAPARREDHVCGLTSFIFEDGTEVARNGALPEKYRVGTATQETLAIDVERPEYLENGQPNISGFWVRAERGGGPATVDRSAAGGAAGGMGGAAGGMGAAEVAGGMGAPGGRGRGTQYDLTEAALAKQATYEQIYDNPSIQCDITNILFGWTHDANVNQVTQEDDQITLLYGYMDFVRTIHLVDEHPENIVLSRGGHSIGHWEDKTLVVDTIGFTPGVFNPLNGEPHSSDMHVVEKFWYDAEAKTLNRSYTIEDPVNLKTPYASQDSLIMSDLPYQPYECIELSGDNNRRPE